MLLDFKNLESVWDNYGFEIVALVSFLIIIILCIYNLIFKKEKGTYSTFKLPKTYSSINNNNNNNNNNKNNNIEYMEHTINDSKLELQSKFILENIFNKPFYKIRPDFLKNDVTGYNLEIDLYNDELKLAIEVQGNQHYKFTPFFHRNKDAFLNQKYRDAMKKEKCKKNGITLIEVPYNVGEKKLKSYLVKQLQLEGYLL
jgi:hypothetical protein